ncbi:MAG: hypothetical protein ABIP55_01470 [Tepidisphaeraceae bacterium]
MPFRPTSNAQRQREFLARNPGYYNKYNARRRAAGQQALVQTMAEFAGLRFAARVEAEATALPVPSEPLMLPPPT